MNIENPTSSKDNPDEPSIVYAPGVEPTNVPEIITPEDVNKEIAQTQLNKDEMKEHKNAILSKASYDYYKYGYAKANEELQRYLPNHHIIDELSDQNATVIQKRDHITISYRGTDPQNPSDIGADIQIVAGNNYSDNISAYGRFREADDKYQSVKNQYPDARVTLTGHSLGASLGIHTGRNYDLEGVFYNPGSSPFSAPTELREAMKTRQNNFTIHHVFGDPISSSNYWLDKSDRIITHYISPTEYAKQFFAGEMGGHPLSNFIREDHQLEWSQHSSQQPYSLGVYLPERVINNCKGGECFLRPKQRQEHSLSKYDVARLTKFKDSPKFEKECMPCPKGKPKCDCIKPKNRNYDME